MNGISQFKKYFVNYAKNYTLIGGMACLIAMRDD